MSADATPQLFDRIHLGLSGSGTLLSSEIGVLVALADAGIGVASMTGTSGGAIVAVLYAAQPDARALARLALEIDFRPMMQFFSFTNPVRLLLRQGICNPGPLHRFLLQRTQGARFRDLDLPLRITATDYQTSRLMVFSAATTPEVRIADAARASSSLPFVYPPARVGGRLYMDGGLCLDIPAPLLPHDAIPAVCTYTVGDHRLRRHWPFYIRPFYQVVATTINALLRGQDRYDRLAAPWVHCVPIDTGQLDVLDTAMAAHVQASLLEAGRAQMARVLGELAQG
ncbi:patatin-like phospholipase family protein [Acidihalobacter ferrooxydans]|uniref:PNPLA domain-containing protein n=1 Tax=Acidihalobacter ferrooxydans TaxID=1765967 RepID=A0A1P8UGK3_9GAMM|nr:patatin-like phospholipase family protein [Acidihalobacter ferrooxydans]APZ42955.1 hypothetical protein BW247_07495 [Acidihalobacter ferrooxydans]